MATSRPDEEDPIRNVLDEIQSKKDESFTYEYENVLLNGNYQQRFHTKNRKITSNRIDYQLPANQIQTAKYSLVNFVPKQLFLQFSKLANLYFLIIGAMQIIPQVSISNQIPVIFLPLSVIVTVSALKDLYEDYKRHKSDQEENNMAVKVLQDDGTFGTISWKQLRVGHIIKLEQDDIIPADILLLKSSEVKGLCYIETKSLDGETNLKMKNVPNLLVKNFNTIESISNRENSIILKYEAPNPYLYRFYGEVIDKQQNKVAINYNSFILRGCILKNVKYLIGLVAYTGHDTKIMLNSFKARSKRSKLENLMQRQIFQIFIIQMIVCTFCALYYLLWYDANRNNVQYLDINSNGVVDHDQAYNFFVRIGNWILIFTNFVPISLLVTLEMVKFIQGFFIIYDKSMKEPTVQSSNLNEELGQIEYIFSDKTGTLTCNKMEFKQITIGRDNYGGIKIATDRYLENIENYPKVKNVDFRDRLIFDILEDPDHPNHEAVIECLYSLSVCHTVITDIKDGDLIYNASSPDELALINFAKFCGFEYLGTDINNIISIKRQNQQIKKYELIETFEFTSVRKRQSVLVKDLDNGQIWLYCKGADSVLLDPLRYSDKEMEQKAKHDILNENLQKYGKVGLRTLVMCKRQIDDIEFEEWYERYQEAAKQLEDRAELMQVLQDEIEKGLDIIGATAIEDKLQKNVGSTIAALKKAGIKVWVLTGDKIETAINIGMGSQLLTDQMKQHIVDEKEESMIRKCLMDIILEMQINTGTQTNRGFMTSNGNQGFQIMPNNLMYRQEINYSTQCQHALIISGDALFHALKPGIQSMVMQIAEQCTAVICCRVSPKQKQDVVNLVRQGKNNCSTLAIGDGANDVNMITAAHVGIGIRGLEGQQAARASDYAVNEFQELRRLLFYHGRESYRRNSRLVCYNFFKNTLLVLPQFWYGSLSVFSAQSLYDSFLYQLFNIFYASIPIIIYAVLDEEHKPDILVANQNNYYAQGLQDSLFNSKVFFLWVLGGVWQASIICYFASYINFTNFINYGGYTSHVWANGTMIYGLVVVVCNFKVLIFSNTYTILSTIAFIGSLLTYLISWIIIDTIPSAEAYQVFQQLWSTPSFHLGNILIICATTMFDLGIEFFSKWSKVLSESQNLAKSDEVMRSRQLDGTKRSSYIGVGKQLYPKGYLNKIPTTHTGFAFCALEREPEQLKYRREYGY